MNKTLLATLAASSLLAFSAQAAPKQGGTLTVPIINTGWVENFNPFTTKDHFHGVIFEPLLVMNNMTGKMEFRLAESLETSKDLKTITLTLRDGLKWSDGKPLTAEDVVFSYNMAKKVPAFDGKGVWSEDGKLASVKSNGKRKVIFNLKAPDSTFIYNIEMNVVPKHIWSKVKDPSTFTNPNPVGSGPMTTVKYVKPQQLEICRNPNYYLKGRPYLDCIMYRSYNDNSQIQPALIKGEIDWASNFIADVESTFVGKDPKNNHFWYPANDAIHLYMNTTKAPFNDLQVRQALSMALDRESIVDIAAYGYPTVNYNVGGIAELYKEHIDKKLNKKYRHVTKYDVKKSKKMLDKAGIVDKDGDGFRDNKDGTPINIEIEVVNGWTDWVQTVQMVTEYFAEVGIRSKVKTVDWAVYDKNLREGTYDMSINWSRVSNNPILAFQDYYHSSRIGKSWHAGHGVKSEEIDALIDSYGLSSDPKKQQQIISKLQKFTAEQMPFIPLFSNPTWFQYSTKKFAGWPSEKNPYVQPVWYDGGKRVIILNNLHLK